MTATDVALRLAGVALAVVTIIITIYGLRRQQSPPKRQLDITVLSRVPIRTTKTWAGELRVMHKDRELQAPYVSSIRLNASGRHDISSALFDAGKPIVLQADVPIVDFKPVEGESESLTITKRDDERAIHVGPDLIHAGMSIGLDLITEGRPDFSTPNHPLIDTSIELRRIESVQSLRPQAHNVSKVLTWAVVSFIAFYLFTQPQSSASVVSGALGLFRQGAESGAESLADFFRALAS